MKLPKMYAQYSTGEKTIMKFHLNAKKTHLAISFSGSRTYTYYVDTLLENYKVYMDGRKLCLDGSSGLCVENMKDIIDWIILNRYVIEIILNRYVIEDKLRGIINKSTTEYVYSAILDEL